MYIKKIIIKNFRLLKDFQIDLEKGLSLIVGKNNTGKTSLLTILQMFLSGTDRKDLTYSDFNLDFRKELKEDIQNEKFDSEKYEEDGIKLRLVIEYDDDDNLEYLSKAIITLEPDNNYVVLGFDYILTKDNLLKLRADYVEFERKESENAHKGKGSYTRLDIDEFLDSRIKKYFSLIRKSIMFDIDKQELDERKFSELKTSDGFRLEDVITFKYISAKRDVDNIERQRTLSSLIADLYEVKEKDERLKDTNEEFKSQMRQTDKQLNNIYKTHFKDIINIVQNFTGVGSDDFKMKITSTLRHKDILNRNVSVVYNQNNQQLPESHNGLGYMNLIAMIVDIERIREEMKREDKQKPADINLLFIEEPEAHTHPQMQYIFIKNIKKLLESGIITSKGEKRRIQTAISTHSSHIVSESQFTDIKYLRREENGNEVKAHNMSDLEKEYADDKDAYRFLKQYLTLTRSELFFADKAIFIEGDTERILIPAMMRKVDEEEKPDVELPLISQNISIIEVGAYSHKFAKFINFIGLKKCIVITDLDIAERCDKKGKIYYCSCEYDTNKTLYTTNAAIKTYMNVDELSKIISLAQNKRLFAWDSDSKGWKQNEQGNMLLCYQQKDNGYQASSFEDAFINLNKDFFLDEQNAFEHGFKSTKLKGLKSQKSVYNFARNGVKSKSALAVEILLNSKENGDRHFSNWEIPSYIKEGLLWLRKD